MMISEFSRATGLSRDTVRFYARLGLLHPEMSAKGGRHPYQVFTDEHVRAARVIRVAQSLGMSLKDIAAIGEERRNLGITRERSIEIVGVQLAKLEAKAAELASMTDFLRAKIMWLEGGEQGQRPELTMSHTKQPLLARTRRSFE